VCGERPTSHVDQILGSGAGHLTHPVLRCTQRDLDQDVCHVCDRNRLDQQRRHRRNLPAPRPPHDHRGEVEELRRSDDGRRDRAGQRHPLLCALAGVVRVALDPVHAHDRQHHMLADARVVFGGQQLPGGGAERPHLLRVDGWGVGDVDHGIDTTSVSASPSPLTRSTPTARASTTASCPARAP
jgi:hypothetical protein